MRRALLIVSMMLAAAAASADTVTLPAAASIQGGNPFFSDVRAFNTSYTASLNVTATYRCFIATVACPATPPQIQITLAPRESKAFDDMVANSNAFDSPDTAGGVEFEFSGSGDQLVVTSRLFSTFPQDSVGMFIPGLVNSDAHPTTVLTSIRHDPNTVPPSGFRTNVGVFNPEDSAVSVTFTIFDKGTNQLGTPVTQSVPGHSGVQVSGIFEEAGLASLSTDNATIVVSASSSVFSYAAVLDNRTADPIFVVGALDQPVQSAPASRTVRVGQGGTKFVDEVSGSGLTTVAAGTKVTWVWEGPDDHSSTSGTCAGDPGPYGQMGPQGAGGCNSSGLWGSGTHAVPYSYSYTFSQAGSFPYFCSVHENAMTGKVSVTAP
jgi:plastocyanin